ncbi:MAG: cellulose biosynthesis protein BcsQ [Vibrio sp.]
MKRIVIVGLKGGVGATTIAANLTSALNSIDQTAHAVDLTRNNQMRLHFGMNPNDGDGWALKVLANQSWRDAAFQNQREVSFVPFGTVTQAQFDEIHHYAQQHEQGYADIFQIPKLKSTKKSSYQWQVLLLPPVDQLDESHYPLLAQADRVFVVVKSDIQSYYALQQNYAYHRLLAFCGEDNKPNLLVSQYQPANEMSRDILLVLQHEFAQQRTPVEMHFDMSVAESIAALTSVVYYAPYCQATQDFHALAFWCLSQIDHRQWDIDHPEDEKAEPVSMNEFVEREEWEQEFLSNQENQKGSKTNV